MKKRRIYIGNYPGWRDAIRCQGKKQKPNKSINERVTKILDSSICTVQAYYKGRDLTGLSIEMAGPLAIFPSTTNGRDIGWVNRKGGGKRPIIKKTSLMLARLEAATTAYMREVTAKGYGIPSFGSRLVHVMVLLADHARIVDSHNHSKAIGDWLAAVGMFDNDSQAEIHCYKKEDYPDPEGEAFAHTTKIIIQDRANVKEINKEIIGSFLLSVAGCSRDR